MNSVVAPQTETLPVVEKPSLASDLSELTKARLTFMVLLTTLVGYGLASHGVFDWLKLFHTLLGTALVAVSSSILNQALERRTDALMTRTLSRPFVTGRLPLRETVIVGILFGLLGLAELYWFVNTYTTVLSALTLVIYVFIYTPLKKVSELNTIIGAIPGALPPLIGTTAALGYTNAEGWALFALLAIWQLAHFYPIAWMHQDDYRAASLRMVSTHDATGRRTGLHALVSALVLVPVSLLPVFLGFSGMFYALCAGTLSVLFAIMAVRFAQQTDLPRARALFFTSIIYLPLVLIALTVDIPLKRWLGW